MRLNLLHSEQRILLKYRPYTRERIITVNWAEFGIIICLTNIWYDVSSIINVNTYTMETITVMATLPNMVINNVIIGLRCRFVLFLSLGVCNPSPLFP